MQNPSGAVEEGSEGVGPWVEPCEVEPSVAWAEPDEEASLASFLWASTQGDIIRRVLPTQMRIREVYPRDA